MPNDVLQQLLAAVDRSPSALQLQPPQQPITPEDWAALLARARPPLAAPGENGGGFAPDLFDLPGLSASRPLSPQLPPGEAPFGLAGGGYSMGRAGRTSEPLNLQMQYNAPGLPIDLAAGVQAGRGGGLSNFMARYRVPF
jgi:hypothetical protein